VLDQENEARHLTLMAAKNASAVKGFIARIACVIMVGFGWLSDPLAAVDQTAAISRLLAWSSLGAAAIALIAAIYFTCRALSVSEPQEVACWVSSNRAPSARNRNNRLGTSQAEFVCKVEIARCPEDDNRIKASTLSSSWISPIITMS
jgi:hypothetical protein